MSLINEYPKDWNPIWKAGPHESPLKYPVFTKEGVKWEGLQPEVYLALGVSYCVFQLLGKEFVVTSLVRDEGKHGEGEAIDLRTYHLSLYEQQEARSRISVALGPRWDVLLEYDPPHLHIERDPD